MEKGSVVRPCTCVHAYQDRRYGAGNRVHNATGPKKQQAGENWRCSVCAKIKAGK